MALEEKFGWKTPHIFGLGVSINSFLCKSIPKSRRSDHYWPFGANISIVCTLSGYPGTYHRELGWENGIGVTKLPWNIVRGPTGGKITWETQKRGLNMSQDTSTRSSFGGVCSCGGVFTYSVKIWTSPPYFERCPICFFVELGTLDLQKDPPGPMSRGWYGLFGCTPENSIIGQNSPCP